MSRTDLVIRARDGDRGAFDVLIATLIDRLYRVARLILRDVDGAEDAVQEALVRCWRDLPRLNEPDRFDAWLNRILMNAVTDEARKRRRFAAGVTVLRLEPAQADDASGIADRDELARVFDRLSLEHRTIVVLHHYLGLTVEEAAAAIGIPVGTAKSRLHNAIETLRAPPSIPLRRSPTHGRLGTTRRGRPHMRGRGSRWQVLRLGDGSYGAEAARYWWIEGNHR